MKIHQLAQPFITNYKPTKDYYEEYFKKHEDIFKYYFERHCRNKEEKLEYALQRHPEKLLKMKDICETMPQIIHTIALAYEALYPIKLTKDIYIIVGLDGSNAYTYRAMDPEITFCVEKLSSDETALKTIIAHEFGHAVHHLLAIRANIEAAKIPWMSPYTWLLQEGSATYLSTQVVQADEDVYFAYEKDEAWLTFCKENEKEIARALHQDLVNKSAVEIFKEWFSINGGEKFGYTRLGYYIGYQLFIHLMENTNEMNALTFWQSPHFEKLMEQALVQLEK